MEQTGDSGVRRRIPEFVLWHFAIWFVILCVLFAYGEREREIPLVVKSYGAIYDGELQPGYHAFIVPWRYGRGFDYSMDPAWCLVTLRVTMTPLSYDAASVVFGDGIYSAGFEVAPLGEEMTQTLTVLAWPDVRMNHLIVKARVTGSAIWVKVEAEG